MSTTPIEVAEEALEKKVEAMKIVDRNSVETKNETDETKPEKRERKFGRMTDEQRRIFWEEEQRNKPVIETNLRGHVKWYSVLGHYGFISRDDGKPDIFVHQSAIIKSHTERIYLRTLADKEVVEFDLVEGKKGLEAANVRGPGGIEVKGSKYQRVLLYRNRPGKRIPERENTEQKEIKQNAEVEVKKEGRKLHRNRRFRKDYGERIDGQKEEINEEKTTVAVVEKKLSNRRHYSRRFRRPRKNTEGKDQDRLAYPIDDNIKAGSRRRMDSQSSLKATDLRCNSALGGGDASLGATAIDAQV